MKRFFPVVIGLFLLVSGAFAQGPFGEIEYVEGDVTLSRGGKSLGALDIGDEIQVDDFIKTGSDGMAVIALNRETGMRGSLTVKARSAVYVRLSPDPAGPKTTIELVAGQIGSKVSKLSGTPTLQVRTDSTIMGVRGTEFGVSTSVSGNVLIYCSEGTVEASDGETTLQVPMGAAVEKRTAEPLKSTPVSLSSPEEFANRWIIEEIEAFRANPVRVMAMFEKQYSELGARFSTSIGELQKSAALRKWLDEDRRGVRVNPMAPETMREKKELIGHIQEIRKILFIYERVYYRMEEAEALIAGTDAESAEIRPDLTVGMFLRRYRSERGRLSRMMSLFRQVEYLYALRDEGGAGLPGLGGDDDFFGSSDF